MHPCAKFAVSVSYGCVLTLYTKMPRILNGEVLAELPQDKPVVLYCKTGQRSAETLAVLKGAGFSDAVHVGGGVVAWANQIDTSLPTY